MTMPNWWTERRFGLLITATAATVPAWTPIGSSAESYRSHMGGLDEPDSGAATSGSGHAGPLVEVLAHQRDRWGHITRYDDFVPLLGFDRFDAEDWAAIASAAGAGYAIHTAKHHDGWAWWDAPGSVRQLTEQGPRRNVVAEFAAACERHDIVFGTAYSLLDWGDDRFPSPDYVDQAMHPQVIDLVERYGSSYLWGTGHRGHDAGVWRSADLLSAVREIDADIVINDGWRASSSDVPDGAPSIVTTYEHTPPSDIVTRPWELVRPAGHSLGHNRNERGEHHMTGVEIVDLFTEVVAKGGNLVLGVGPAADGCVPETQASPLRDAGTWIRRHAAVLADTTPWTHWGDDDVRYLSAPSQAGTSVIAVDIAGTGRFGALSSSTCRVVAVTLLGTAETDASFDIESADALDADGWTHDETGLRLHAIQPRDPAGFDPIGIRAYRVDLETADQPIELFAPADIAPIPIAPLLDDARPGDIVQLGDATYLGPAIVPTGVIVRGLGPNRTFISLPESDTPSIVPPPSTLTVGQNARVEHLSVIATGSPERVARPLVNIDEQFGSILGCVVGGSIAVSAPDVLIRAVTGQGVVADDADRLRVSRCKFTGNGWDTGVEVRRGEGHHVESTNFAGHLCAVRTTQTTGSTVRGNSITARRAGVHLDHCEGAHVHGNRVDSTMRAVDIDGGAHCVVDGNAVTNGDSGCIVQDGAASCEIYGNHWDRCRIGLLSWDGSALHHRDNTCSNLHEPDGAAVDALTSTSD